MTWCFPTSYLFERSPQWINVFFQGGLLGFSFFFFFFALGPSLLLVALFSCCLSIWLFCYDLSIPIFCCKIFFLPLHHIVWMSLCIPLLAGGIIFHCFFCIVWSCLSIFLVFLLFVILSNLFSWVVSFDLILLILAFFVSLNIFSYSRHLTFDSSLISHPGLEFRSLFFRETPILVHTNFTPASLGSFNFVMLFVGIYVNSLFIFI